MLWIQDMVTVQSAQGMRSEKRLTKGLLDQELLGDKDDRDTERLREREREREKEKESLRERERDGGRDKDMPDEGSIEGKQTERTNTLLYELRSAAVHSLSSKMETLSLLSREAAEAIRNHPYVIDAQGCLHESLRYPPP